MHLSSLSGDLQHEEKAPPMAVVCAFLFPVMQQPKTLIRVTLKDRSDRLLIGRELLGLEKLRKRQEKGRTRTTTHVATSKVPEGHHPRGKPFARLSEEICLSEGSAGVSQRALRGSL